MFHGKFSPKKINAEDLRGNGGKKVFLDTHLKGCVNLFIINAASLCLFVLCHDLSGLLLLLLLTTWLRPGKTIGNQIQ